VLSLDLLPFRLQINFSFLSQAFVIPQNRQCMYSSKKYAIA
jgi:hypothetical protein